MHACSISATGIVPVAPSTVIFSFKKMETALRELLAMLLSFVDTPLQTRRNVPSILPFTATADTSVKRCSAQSQFFFNAGNDYHAEGATLGIPRWNRR